MPVLVKGGYEGEVTWLGSVPDGGSIRSEATETLELGFHGISGERHEGENRSSCSRVSNLYPEGTEIRNVRQLTILSAEEMEATAADIGLEKLDPQLLGATIVLSGIPDFTHVPPSSRLQSAAGLTLTVDMENRPCHLPAREIEQDEPGHGAAFKAAAAGRRGVTAWVERPGSLRLGDRFTLFVPDQRGWQP